MVLRTVLLVAMAAALAIPSQAVAGSRSAALAQERYYSSYGSPAASASAAPAPDADDDAGTWKALAIGGGALVLLLGTAELVTLSRLRRLTAV